VIFYAELWLLAMIGSPFEFILSESFI